MFQSVPWSPARWVPPAPHAYNSSSTTLFLCCRMKAYNNDSTALPPLFAVQWKLTTIHAYKTSSTFVYHSFSFPLTLILWHCKWFCQFLLLYKVLAKPAPLVFFLLCTKPETPIFCSLFQIWQSPCFTVSLSHISFVHHSNCFALDGEYLSVTATKPVVITVILQPFPMTRQIWANDRGHRSTVELMVEVVLKCQS